MFIKTLVLLLVSASLLHLSAAVVQTAPPQILAANLEINDLLQANGVQSYTVSFLNAFTVKPQFATAIVGWTLENADKTHVQGVQVNFADGDVTVNGATFNVTPSSDWKKLTLRWVATYGDYLQVFPLETGTLPSPAQEYLLLEIPFDFSKLVFSDTSSQVVVSTFLSGFSAGFMHIGSTIYINEIAVFPGN